MKFTKFETRCNCEYGKCDACQLTREQAVKFHRELWGYITDQYKAGSIADIQELKTKYLDSRNLEVCMSNPMCTYAEKERKKKYPDRPDICSCKYCPASASDTIFQDRVISFKCMGGLERELENALDTRPMEKARGKIISLCEQIRDYNFRKW